VQRQGFLCCLSVADSGPGIPQDEQERIFQNYQRGRLAQGQPGAGLGLSVVRRIATLHGGRVRLQSQPGHGTCFVVELAFWPDSS
jgi:signal transduction histidine kinase